MHSSEAGAVAAAQGAALLLELGALIVEGRAAGPPAPPGPGPGPRAPLSRQDGLRRLLQAKLGKDKAASSSSSAGPAQSSRARLTLAGHAEALWREHIPLCIEALLAPACSACRGPLLLLERWTMSVYCKRVQDSSNHITSQWLLNAVRSQLHFSQISAWTAKLKEDNSQRKLSPSERQRKLSRETCNFKKYESNCDEEELMRESSADQEKKSKKLNVVYSLKIPGETYKIADFQCQPVKHTFPITDIGSNVYLKVSLESLPRLEDIPIVRCGCGVLSNPGTLKRRRSKDLMVGNIFTEDVLASTLAAACTLAEVKASCSRAFPGGGQDTNGKKLEGLADECKARIKGATFSMDLGIINPDMGCASGISRKFPIYSTANNSELYHNPSSRDSTPEHQSDFNDPGISCTANVNCEGPLHQSCKRKSMQDSSYQPQYEDTSNIPLDNVLKTTYVMVDDRMQTPCRQKGKHRCNCDEESDQGTKESKDSSWEKSIISEKLGLYKAMKDESKPESEDAKGKVVLDERRTKEIAKYMRRLRKEAKLRQMRESGQSSQDNSESTDKQADVSHKERSNGKDTARNKDLISTKISSIDASKPSESEQRNSPELVHYRNTCHHSCKSCGLFHEQKNMMPTTEPLKSQDLTGSRISICVVNQKPPENITTSIPILQASRFDHVNRFSNFRSTVSRHGGLSTREVYSVKDSHGACSSGIEQVAAVKTCYQYSDQNTKADFTYQAESPHCQRFCQLTCCKNDDSSRFCNSGDNYRPSVKKLISSYTQTDEFRCECGKPLIPKCFECSKACQGNYEDGGLEVRMKRSKGSHDLAAVNKSDLLLEAMERTSRLSGSLRDERDECVIDAIECCDMSGSGENGSQVECLKEVIENKCDNRNRLINKCECDNIEYCNRFKNSDNHDMLSMRALLYSRGQSSKDSGTSGSNDLKGGDSAVSASKEKENIDVANLQSKNNSDTARNFSRYKDFVEKLDSFIRKPKLKRQAPIVDKLDKIVTERHEQKFKDSMKLSELMENSAKTSKRSLYIPEDYSDEQEEDYLYKDEESGITYMTSPSHSEYLVNNTFRNMPRSRSDSIVRLLLSKDNQKDENEKHVVVYEKGDYGTFGQHDDESRQSRKSTEINNSSELNDSSNLTNPDEVCQCNSQIAKVVDGDLKWKEAAREIFGICNGNCPQDNIVDRMSRSGSYDHSAVPSVSEMDRFRWRLDSAASMVFHSRTGLPLTSSPAPLRRGKSCFDYDSSINSVSGIKSALYSAIVDPELHPAWSPGSSPGSPSHGPGPAFNFGPAQRQPQPTTPTPRSLFRHGASSGLLGSFEESVLNGRLEPAATVAGFTAEIGASGAFCPPHLKLPVTVFFYSLGDNTTSAPYLGHINLGKRGYCVPRSGTIQATLFNPHGTVVKMFVVMYDLAAMPANSRTFLRQRTLCLPAGTAEKSDPRCLRYLIHLRFLTSKSGKVYLHTDIRIIVSRKADLDTAAAHSLNSALALQRLNSQGYHRKNKIETGTFERRTKKKPEEERSPQVTRMFGGCDSDINSNNLTLKKKMNRSIGCFELANLCKKDGIQFQNSGKENFENGNSTEQFEVDEAKELCDNRKQCSDSNSSASVLTKELSYELRSFTYGPENPKYSPR